MELNGALSEYSSKQILAMELRLKISFQSNVGWKWPVSLISWIYNYRGLRIITYRRLSLGTTNKWLAVFMNLFKLENLIPYVSLTYSYVHLPNKHLLTPGICHRYFRLKYGPVSGWNENDLLCLKCMGLNSVNLKFVSVWTKATSKLTPTVALQVRTGG